METLLTPAVEKPTTVRGLRLMDQNSKKNCPCMIEVNLAPKAGIPESVLRSTLFQITWDDGTIGQYQLEDILRCRLYDLPSSITWQSHGKTAFEFVSWFHQQYPGSTPDTQVAAYFYRKLP